MSGVREIKDDIEFDQELLNAGSKLVVVDFKASWCGPCQIMAPIYEQLPSSFPNVVFLQVDVDMCTEIAANQDVVSLPTFQFYRNNVKVATCVGADPSTLELTIRSLCEPNDPAETEETDPNSLYQILGLIALAIMLLFILNHMPV